jgi:hypothetical protein
MRELARKTPMDAAQNYRAMLREITDKLYYKGQLSPPNNLLNPFAWAAFINDWKRQRDSRKIEAQKKMFEMYGEDDDYIPPPPSSTDGNGGANDAGGKNTYDDEDF